MSSFKDSLIRLYLRFTGFSYTNMARLFMRLFVGVMFMQFGIRQLTMYHELVNEFPSMLGLSPQACLVIMITIELVCSLLIMVGFLTRFATIPAVLSMTAAEVWIANDLMPHINLWGITSTQPGYLPVMFIGIFLFLLLAGPGKISVDYFLSIFIISRQGRDEKEELEEV
ncbi:MAG: DoxX family protein [Firmicutes bacterium]|nr:DoxX family protein [Bacillota bacterium]MCM1401214.1 DoxX family protein [Bacteroides sp.]MCM1477089.1 DoxX family protein [Bacteroides sp.]